MALTAIVGAGPAGLAVAAALQRRGIDCRIIDRSGCPGGAYRTMYPRMTLSSPACFNGLAGLSLEAKGEYLTAAEYQAYLTAYAKHFALPVERGEVRAVRRVPGGFELDVSGAQLKAASVVVATGLWDFPVIPDIAGLSFTEPTQPLPAEHVRAWRGPDAPPSRLLVIGAGMSAVETAQEAARAGAQVWISIRGKLRLSPRRILGRDVHHWIGPIERIPTWLSRHYCRTRHTLAPTDLGFSRFRKEGRIQTLAAIVGVEGKTVRDAAGSEVEVDRVVAATGFRFETPFLPNEVSRAPAGHLLARHGQSVSWPGLFVVGHPCSVQIKSQFLRGIREDAETVAQAVLEKAQRKRAD